MDLILKFSWAIITAFILLISFIFQKKTGWQTLNIFKIFKKIKQKDGITEISSFATLMVTLGGKIGVGSIAGVALAIYYGGVGSLFWLAIVSLFCAVLSYVETVLGMKFRVKKSTGYFGGPSYYITKGLHNKRLGIIYSILILVCYIGGFLAIQTNTITKSIQNFSFLSPTIIGFILVILTTFCIVGGLKEISKVSKKLIPFMMFFYLFLSCIILLKNIHLFPQLIKVLLTEAFQGSALSGGILGTIIIGVQRGIFSTEVGIGTGSLVASTTTTNCVSKQAAMQTLGVYITGILVCGATAIFILCSPYQDLSYIDFNGIELVSYAFSYHFGKIGSYLLSFFIFLFSFSTILTGYYYGEISLNFLVKKNKKRYLLFLKLITLFNVFLGCFLSPTFLWKIVDWLVAVLIAINLYAMFKLKEKINDDL